MPTLLKAHNGAGLRPRWPGTLRAGCTSILACVLAGAFAPAAHASGGDAAATHAYLQADHVLVQTGVSHIPRIEATLHGVLARVRSECPRAAEGSPQDPQSTQLSDEVIGTMVLAVVALDRPAGWRFLAATEHLSWSNHALTRKIDTYDSDVRRLLTLPQPNLCSDIKAWVQSGFKTLPATTAGFVARFMAAWVGLGELPAALAHTVAPADHPLLARTEHLESQFTELEAREVETYGQIMDTLELSP
ncbi:MAG TPA: hypothetical protein VGW98_10425 [Solirubrobacteraceae bacterium]|jgi:hypothetical protein|nr:hypothetical protein [Solirubrobacteraceae bacterium]